MAKEGSKFCEGSRAHQARMVVLAEIRGRMLKPVIYGGEIQISQRTGAGCPFSDLQDEAAQAAIVRRRASHLASAAPALAEVA